MKNNMEDSGKRQEFKSGAVRDSADGKSRPDLQSPYAQERIGHWLRLGAEKYNERNWEAGMSFSRCVASIERHLVAYKMGRREEDHLAAIAVNAQFLMHYEEMMKLELLPHSLDDMPHYYRQFLGLPVKIDIKQDIDCSPESQFKAGDKVKIKLRKTAGSDTLERCRKNNNVGRYLRYGFQDRGQDMHYVVVGGSSNNVFYTDELTFIAEDI